MNKLDLLFLGNNIIKICKKKISIGSFAGRTVRQANIQVTKGNYSKGKRYSEPHMANGSIKILIYERSKEIKNLYKGAQKMNNL